jgi:hypothetical protein
MYFTYPTPYFKLTHCKINIQPCSLIDTAFNTLAAPLWQTQILHNYNVHVYTFEFDMICPVITKFGMNAVLFLKFPATVEV